MPAKTVHRKVPHTDSKVKVLPVARPTPPSPDKRPEPRPDVSCSSGEDCPAFSEIGRPERIRATKGKKGYCDRCERRRAEAITKDLESRRLGGAPRTDTV